MFRFLIVEDEKHTLTDLEDLLHDTFDECEVDTAGAAADGESLIEETDADDGFYDAAILDLRIPEHEGEHAEINGSLSRRLATMPTPTVIARITSFPKDKKVQEMVKEQQVERLNPTTFTLSKLDADWPNRLMNRLECYLYGFRIRTQMNELFGHNGSSGVYAGAHRRRGAGLVERDTTHRLAALCRDIERYWQHLEESLQNEIRDLFKVHETEEGVRVTVL